MKYFPPGTVYILGAGSGNSKFIHCAHAKSSTDVVLIEGVKKKYQQLKGQWCSRVQGWQFENIVVSNGFGDNIFYNLSLTSESGLISASLLCHVWPKITTLSSKQCNLLTLQDVYELGHQERGSWLILDYFISVKLLNADALKNVNVLVIRVPCCEDLPEEMNENVVVSAITDFGFKIAAKESNRDNKNEYWVCVRDVNNAFVTLAEECRQAETDLIKVKDECQVLKNKTKALEAKVLELEKVETHLKSLIDTERKNKQKERIEREELFIFKVNDLEERVCSLLQEQKNFIKQTTNALGQHITKSLPRDNGSREWF